MPELSLQPADFSFFSLLDSSAMLEKLLRVTSRTRSRPCFPLFLSSNFLQNSFCRSNLHQPTLQASATPFSLVSKQSNSSPTLHPNPLTHQISYYSPNPQVGLDSVTTPNPYPWRSRLALALGTNTARNATGKASYGRDPWVAAWITSARSTEPASV